MNKSTHFYRFVQYLFDKESAALKAARIMEVILDIPARAVDNG
jgi:hypothetical protein